MPLIIDHSKENNLTCPRFLCDVCGGLIERADDAVVAWNSKPGERATPAILHTGCDASLPRELKQSQWMALDHLVVYLLHNLKMDQPSKLEKARGEVERLSQLGL
jgi:hypothetical protein